MARTAELAGVRDTVVDVELAVLPLETFGAVARIGPHQVAASRPVLTWGRFAFVDFLLAVRAGVSLQTVTPVGVADIFAGAVVAQPFHRYSFSHTCILTADHLHIADLARPSRCTRTLIVVLDLVARSPVLAGVRSTPIHVLTAILSGITRRTVASIVSGVILTGSAVQARRAIAKIDPVLAVRAGVAGFAGTTVGVDAVDAGTAVHAATSRAVFVVSLAVYAGESERAGTGVGVDVLVAGGSVLAGMRGTFVYVDLALFSFETVHAQAGIVSDVVQTGATVLARK